MSGFGVNGDEMRSPDLETSAGRVWSIDLATEVNPRTLEVEPDLVGLWVLEAVDRNIARPHAKLEIHRIPENHKNGLCAPNYRFRLVSMEPAYGGTEPKVFDLEEYRLISGGEFYSTDEVSAQAMGASAVKAFLDGNLKPEDSRYDLWALHMQGK